MRARLRSEVMVGCEQELRVLRDLAAQARSGRPATAIVLGECRRGQDRPPINAKLGAANRTEAAAVAHPQGLVGSRT